MDREFYSCWFGGLTTGLANLSREQRNAVLAACGKACSESGSLAAFRRARDASCGCGDFFEWLQREIPAMEARELKKDRLYEIRYRECLCDLYRDGMMDTPILCECSRQSLLHNLRTVFPGRQIVVELKGSILGGDAKCRLAVHFENEG